MKPGIISIKARSTPPTTIGVQVRY